MLTSYADSTSVTPIYTSSHEGWQCKLITTTVVMSPMNIFITRGLESLQKKSYKGSCKSE